MTNYDQRAVRKRYGRTPGDDAMTTGYLKAVKIIVGADGAIPAEEQKALEAGMAQLGISDDVRKEIEAFDHANAKLEDVLPGIKQGGLRAKMLLRDAIEIASADGHYAKEEREAAAKAAQLLGVDEGVLKSIEALVELERGARHLRRALFPKKD